MTLIPVDPVVLEAGIWCDRCLKPSRLRVRLVMLTIDGAGSVGEATICVDELEDS